MGCAVSSQANTGGDAAVGKRKKRSKKKPKKQQGENAEEDAFLGAAAADDNGAAVAALRTEGGSGGSGGSATRRLSMTAKQRRKSFGVDVPPSAGVSSQQEVQGPFPDDGNAGLATREPERAAPMVMNPLVASPARIASGGEMPSISLPSITGGIGGVRTNSNSNIPHPPPNRNHSSGALGNAVDSNGRTSQVSGSFDGRSHSLVPIGARESATSSNRKNVEERLMIGQVRGGDVASNCSDDGSIARSGKGGHNDGVDDDEASDSRSDVEDARRPSEFPDQTADDPEVEAMRLSCPEFHVDAAPLAALVQLVRAGMLPINQNGDHTIGGAFRTKMRFRDVAGWMAEVGTIPAGVVSLSHQDRRGGGQGQGSNEQKLTSRLLEQNHRLLLQLRSRTSNAPSSTVGVYNSNIPLNFVASLGVGPGADGVGGVGPASPLYPSPTVQPPPVLANGSGAGGDAPSGTAGGLLTSSQHAMPPNMFTKASGEQSTLLGGGASFDDDVARRYSRGSNRNKIPDRNTAAEDEFDVTNFYEELEDEERRLSTIKESSSDEDF